MFSPRAIGVASYWTRVARGFQVADLATLERLVKIVVLAALPRRRLVGLASVLQPVSTRKNSSFPKGGDPRGRRTSPPDAVAGDRWAALVAGLSS